MRRDRWTATGVVAAVLLVTGAAPADGRARHCARSGTHNLAADARGRLYEDKHHAVYACLNARDRPVLIDEFDPDLLTPVVSSPFAAVVIVQESPVAPSNELQVIDMRTGKAVTPSLDASPGGLVLTKHGTGAILLNPLYDSAAQMLLAPARVQRFDRAGKLGDLDSGNLDTGSLALSRTGRTVYWTKDGVAHSARL